jgi:hypothetical protein
MTPGGWSTNSWADGSWEAGAWGEVSGANYPGWADGAWATGTWANGAWGAETGLNLAIDTPGGITLAGQGFTTSLSVALTNGAVTLAGQAFKFTWSVPWNEGNITLAGQPITTALSVAFANGAVTLAGQDFTTALTQHLFVTIDTPGAVTLEGQPVTIARDLDVEIDTPGAVTISGQDLSCEIAIRRGQTPGGSGYPVYWQGRRRKRRLEDQPNLHLKKVLDDVVNELYGELTEDDVPPAVQAKAAKLVKPFVEQKSKKLAIPPESAVDWTALERDASRVRQIIALWRKQEFDAEIEAEDEYLLLVE